MFNLNTNNSVNPLNNIVVNFINVPAAYDDSRLACELTTLDGMRTVIIESDDKPEFNGKFALLLDTNLGRTKIVGEEEWVRKVYEDLTDTILNCLEQGGIYIEFDFLPYNLQNPLFMKQKNKNLN